MIQARQEEIREEGRRRQQQERLAGEGEEGAELLVAAGVQELHIGSSATATVRLLFLYAYRLAKNHLYSIFHI